MFEGIHQGIHFFYQWSTFHLEESALAIGDLVFWRGRPFPIDWRFGIGVRVYPTPNIPFRNGFQWILGQTLGD
jgi:hypothetical protein